MSRRNFLFIVFPVLLFFLLISSLLFGLRFNFSHSFPPGLYWLNTRLLPEKGNLVFICPTPSSVFDLAKSRHYLSSGVCPGDYQPLIKRVVAMAGDEVRMSDTGVWVNGALEKNSVPLIKDLAGRAMPIFSVDEKVPEGKVLVLSDYNALSFDGRYFGYLDKARIQGVTAPIFTW